MERSTKQVTVVTVDEPEKEALLAFQDNDASQGDDQKYESELKRRTKAGKKTEKYTVVAIFAGILLLAVLLWSALRSRRSSLVSKHRGWQIKKIVNDGASRQSKPAASTRDDGAVVFGLGIGDITGPIVQTNMMGYAASSQTNTGLHTRLRARAFVVGSASSIVPPPNSPPIPAPSDPQQSPGGEVDPSDGLQDRWVLINTDLCMGDTAVRRGLIAKLRQAYPGGVYGERNVAFIGTHSHAGIAGFHNNLLPTFTSGGVVQQNYDAIVEGSFRAVQKAHEDFEARKTRTATANANARGAASSVFFGNATLKEAHVNRSPYAYDFNPPEWKNRYENNQDDEFALLKFQEAGDAKGFASFYPVHGTSLSANNTLTSTDNKGLAALWYEQMAEPSSLPGQNSFVAGFVQANVGDTTPNTLGAKCPDGSPCDWETSTCRGPDGKNTTETCLGRGPGFGDEAARLRSPTGGYDWKSNEIIAQLQVNAAKGIMDRSDLTPLTGTVKSVKLNVDMNSYSFSLPNGTNITTCPAALGFSFGGGTTDYPGPKGLGLEQGTNSSDHSNPLLEIVSHLIRPPSPATTKCHLPKKILLATGQLDLPYQWSPHVVETQILQVGSAFVLVMPAEFTTMAGRLLKEAVKDELVKRGLAEKPILMLAGPANTYSHYVTTLPEYNAQRYEGGSTLYGPYTLDAYIHIYTQLLVPALLSNNSSAGLPQGKLAPINIRNAFKLQKGVVYDNAPFGKRFGDVLVQPNATYAVPGGSAPAGLSSNVSVSFVGANPRNDLKLESTFFSVQRQTDSAGWQTARTDSHHSTTMRWTQTDTVTGTSRVDIGWAIEAGTPPGKYRVVYYGNSKTPVAGSIKAFNGTTQVFTLQ